MIIHHDRHEFEKLRGRVVGIAKRLCEVETWVKLVQRITGDLDDDITKLREELDEHRLVIGSQEGVIQAQAARIAKLELLTGTAIESHEVDA